MYYVIRAASGFTLELRQDRYKSNPGHPHDVCAVARNVEELRGMVEEYLEGDVDWSRVETLSGLEAPAGYKPVAWADVQVGQDVWLAGVMDDNPHAYGPHEVYLGHPRRELINHTVVRGRPLFPHYAEDLLVQV